MELVMMIIWGLTLLFSILSFAFSFGTYYFIEHMNISGVLENQEELKAEIEEVNREVRKIRKSVKKQRKQREENFSSVSSEQK